MATEQSSMGFGNPKLSEAGDFNVARRHLPVAEPNWSGICSATSGTRHSRFSVENPPLGRLLALAGGVTAEPVERRFGGKVHDFALLLNAERESGFEGSDEVARPGADDLLDDGHAAIFDLTPSAQRGSVQQHPPGILPVVAFQISFQFFHFYHPNRNAQQQTHSWNNPGPVS